VLFSAIMQRVAVIPYRRFGTTSRNVGKELPLIATSSPEEHISHLLCGRSL